MKRCQMSGEILYYAMPAAYFLFYEPEEIHATLEKLRQRNL